MGPNKYKCIYVNCTSTSENHSMFRFPYHDKERFKIWVENSGNIHLDLTEEQWLRRFLCEQHFDPRSIHINNQVNRLIGKANPLKYNSGNKTTEVISSDSHSPDLNPSSSVFHSEVSPPRKVYKKGPCRTPKESGSSSSQNSSQFMQDLSMPSSENQNIKTFCQDEKCLQTRLLLEASRKTSRTQASQIAWFKEKLANENLYERKFRTEASKTIAGMQFVLRPQKRKWKDEEKRFSLALYDKSPACYRLMLRKGIVLPSLEIIDKWLSESTCLPVAGDCGSLTEERNDDNNIMMIEREDVATSIKEEHEEDCASMNELFEDDGTRVKEEQEEYYEVSVKGEFDEDSSDSATAPAALYAEHEVKSEFTLEPDQY